MIIEDVVQGSPDWLAMRVGRVTGSRVSDVLSYLKKGGESQARKDYKAEIVCEILTGLAAEHYVSPAMEWGTANEEFARAAYEIERDATVNTIGFAVHPHIDRFGASPDGLVGDRGLIEIKCPNTSTHIDYLLADEVPEQYQPQMLAEMACTGREWCDFISFDPRLPKNLQLFVKRFDRDEERIGALEREVGKFLEEVDVIVGKLREL